MKAVLTSLKTAFLHVSSNAKYISAYFTNHCFAVLRKFLGSFWAFWERGIFSQRIG